MLFNTFFLSILNGFPLLLNSKSSEGWQPLAQSGPYLSLQSHFTIPAPGTQSSCRTLSCCVLQAHQAPSYHRSLAQAITLPCSLLPILQVLLKVPLSAGSLPRPAYNSEPHEALFQGTCSQLQLHKQFSRCMLTLVALQSSQLPPLSSPQSHPAQGFKYCQHTDHSQMHIPNLDFSPKLKIHTSNFLL